MTALSSTAARRANAAAIFAVAVTVLSWASAFPMIRFGMRELGPLELAAARFAVASVLALAWLAITPAAAAEPRRRRALRDLRPDRHFRLQRPAQPGRAHGQRRRGGVHRQHRADPDRHSRHHFSARAVFGLGLERRADQFRRRRPDRARPAGRAGVRRRGEPGRRGGAVHVAAISSSSARSSPATARSPAPPTRFSPGRCSCCRSCPARCRGCSRLAPRRWRRRSWRSAYFPRRSAMRPGPTRWAGSARRAPPISSISCRQSRRWSAMRRSAKA